MSSVLFDLASASSATRITTCPTNGHRRNSNFPFRARFRRRATLPSPDSPNPLTEVSVANTIFPVGARFPRRSTADVIVYLAEQELRRGPVATAHPVFPIGARFPLR